MATKPARAQNDDLANSITSSGNPNQLQRKQRFVVLVIVVLAAGLIGSLGGWIISVNTPQSYEASATFRVSKRPSNAPFVSPNKRIIAEQTIRELRKDHTGLIKAQLANNAITGIWIPGPGTAELSYRVRASSSALAEQTAQAIYEQAGAHGEGFISANGPDLYLKRQSIHKAVAIYKARSIVVAGAGTVSAVCAMAIMLSIGTRARGAHQPSQSDSLTA